jgi:methionyl-tRNA formyltransferase
LSVILYVMNYKGLRVLESFVAKFGAHSVDYVVSAQDNSVIEDYYVSINDFCKLKKIKIYNKSHYPSKSLGTTLRFAIGWRWIIEDTENLIVLHDSLLPKYRGFSPLVNMLVNGETKIGVTAITAENDFDSGDILDVIEVDIEYPIKIKDAIEIITPLYSEIVCNIYEKKLNNSISLSQQSSKDATYSLWLDDQDYLIDWSWSADKIKRFIDATGFPFKGAATRINNQIFRIKNAAVIEDIYIIDRGRHLGKIIFIKNSYLYVICGQNLLKITEIESDDNSFINIKHRTRFH